QGRSLCAIGPSGAIPPKCPPTPTAIIVGTATLTLSPDGSFTATRTGTATSAATVTFSYRAMNEQRQASAAANITVTFPAATGLVVAVGEGTSQTRPHSWRPRGGHEEEHLLNETLATKTKY